MHISYITANDNSEVSNIKECFREKRQVQHGPSRRALCWMNPVVARSSLGSFSSSGTFDMLSSASASAHMHSDSSHRLQRRQHPGQKLRKTPVFFPGKRVVTLGLCLQEMVDWFNAIRAARFHYLQVAFPGASDEEVRKTQGLEGKLWWHFARPQSLFGLSFITLRACTHFWHFLLLQLVPKLTRNFMKEGFMEKTGPKVCTMILIRRTIRNYVKFLGSQQNQIAIIMLNFKLVKEPPSFDIKAHICYSLYLWE